MRPSAPARSLAHLLIAWTLVACSSETPTEPPSSVSPDAVPSPVDAAGMLTLECDQALAEAETMLARLEADAAVATVDNVLVPYNDLLVRIFDNDNGSSLLHNVHPDPAVRDAAGECERRFTALDTRLKLSRPLYERIAALRLDDADAKTRRFVEKTLLDFRLKGVDKDAETRARIQSLDEEINRLGQEFDRNIADGGRSIWVDSVDDLAGLPADWIARHPPGDDGRIEITTAYPDYQPFMRYAQDDELRRALFMEYMNRAWPENGPVLEALIARRAEIAALQGFDTWADAATADKMIGNGANAREFIEAGLSGSRDAAEADYALLLERRRQADPEATEVAPWQAGWLTNKIRQERYGVASEALRPYFAYPRVRDGIFQLTTDLFGVEIRPRPDAERWHESVEAYEFVEDGEVLGRFYLDMHPRDGKYTHAAHFYRKTGLADRLTPESALVCNFPGGDDGPGLMEQSQVETFLHEFGHLIHYHFRYHQPWQGISQPERDFMEAPSMMLEEWIYDADTLRRFAVNDEGEPIPAEMVGRMRAARAFGQGLMVNRQLRLAALSLGLYDRDPGSLDVDRLYRDLLDEHSVVPYPPGTHEYASFPHLNGYSAFYYTYMWSQAIAYDMLTRFETSGLRNRETALDYRRLVLEPGGSVPAAEAVGMFLGRPFNFDAFEKRLNSGG